MSKNLSRYFGPALVTVAALLVSTAAFAHEGWPYPVAAAPEFDPRLAIEGIAVAGGAAALLWEGIRRRRNK